MNESAVSRPWVDYYRACLAHPGVVRRVEQVLDELRATSVSVRETADALTGQGVTYDQVARVLTALHALGVLKMRTDSEYVLDSREYASTRSGRVAALGALSWAGAAPNELGECELLVAAPSDVSPSVKESYERQFFDLRTTIRSILAEAQSRVLLAAPFWDLEVAADLAEILRRRQQAGVRVAILGRQPQSGSTNEYALAAIRAALPPSSGCEIRILERPSVSDPFGSSTFHFKAACADAAHVYLGSANFNTAGLGSRWELGVRLGGRRARLVAELLETLWLASRPF
jgi:phosphatidylserine/phosphatidylglycerophosphate/cardiolipin synthase-like enzyme